jgi:hypothetical protein
MFMDFLFLDRTSLLLCANLVLLFINGLILVKLGLVHQVLILMLDMVLKVKATLLQKKLGIKYEI